MLISVKSCTATGTWDIISGCECNPEYILYYYNYSIYFCKLLSRLCLRVTRIYLHCGISHWADIYIHVETFRTLILQNEVRPDIIIPGGYLHLGA